MSSIPKRPIVVAFKTLLIVVAAVALGSAQNSHDVPTQFNEFTIAQLQDAMSHHRITSEGLTRYYINRIFALDQNGPGVNSVIELNPDAIELAERADAMRRSGATAAGVVSRAGVVPISHTQDTVGPHGRTVADAVIALNAIASRTPDAGDAATRGVPLGWQRAIPCATGRRCPESPGQPFPRTTRHSWIRTASA